jgi:2-amino-4-hydroxy-6-hydroxymethyldihydropteridine diphosphokinase
MKAGALHSSLPTTDLAFVALGSNLGDSRILLRQAMERLQAFSEQPLLKSSLWQSTPVDCPPCSHLFVNAVVGLAPRASETPESLLEKLQKLEREFGRAPKSVLNEPRLLDLDLIAFAAEKRSTPQLTLPHPRAHLRRFVLEPLAEIAPDYTLPRQSKTARELLAALGNDEIVTRISLEDC